MCHSHVILLQVENQAGVDRQVTEYNAERNRAHHHRNRVASD